MAIELTLSNGGGQLEFHPGLPSNYNGPILCGASRFYAKTNTASIAIQELVCDKYTIRFSISKFLKKITATGSLKAKGLYSYFMLKNGMRKEFESIGKMHLRQDQFSCFFTEPTTCKAKFEENIEYRTFDLFYSPGLLEELVPFFPELKNVIESSPSTLLTAKTFWATPSMNEIINHVLNCQYDEASCQFYFDLKVRELLYQAMENAFRRKASQYNFTPWEIARIHDARNILEAHISKKPPTISSLSKQVRLNEFKLKTGFRQYFNSGIFEWLFDRKMHHARQLILTTDKPIKDIAHLTGYPLTTNFITAFRRKFGMTPGSLRG